MFQGRDPTKTVNIAVSSRALFNLEEEHITFIEKGLDEYVKTQVEKENKVLFPGSAFSFIKVNAVLLGESMKPLTILNHAITKLHQRNLHAPAKSEKTISPATFCQYIYNL